MSVPDPVAMAHRSALRSIARVVEETGSPTDPTTAAQSIAEQLREGGVAVLTGAGVSTDSGIPDYRGPHGSLGRHRPMTYQEFRYDPAAAHRYWARSFIGWRTLSEAAPNPTHFPWWNWNGRAWWMASSPRMSMGSMRRRVPGIW